MRNSGVSISPMTRTRQMYSEPRADLHSEPRAELNPTRREPDADSPAWMTPASLRRLPTKTESAANRKPGFSLLEMMIAMVILGLGLIMVATIFPVAWTRARTLAEFTTQSTVTASAHTTLQMIARVDSADTTAGTFAGEPLISLGFLRIADDSRVHLLHMENMLVGAAQQAITPDRANPSLTMSPAPPWKLERADLQIPETDLPTEFFESTYGAPRVRFESRLHPPLRWRDPDSAVTDSAGVFRMPDPNWEGELDQRRFAWSILHRRTEPLAYDLLPGMTTSDLESALSQPRTFDIYYVTLRRSQATHRFAQQDADSRNTPNPAERQNPDTPVEAVTPRALDPDEDVLIPVPWRVQVFFPDETVLASKTDPGNLPSGVPTEIEVNTDNAETAEFVIDMFTVGTPFIDEESGQIYRVVRRRIIGEDLDQAILTLDREIFIEDIDDGYFDPPNPTIDNFGNGTIEHEEQLRTVWVFPPRVTDRDDGDPPSFVGKQPVVGIDVRTLNLRPPS